MPSISAPQMQSGTPTSDEECQGLLEAIRTAGWWQGSVIPAEHVAHLLAEVRDVSHWIIASQACNIYNGDFEKIPVIELVGAQEIEQCSAAFSKGDNPRELHIHAEHGSNFIALKIDIQTRVWLSRVALAGVQASPIKIRDALPGSDSDWKRKLRLDSFAGWIARSYTRVALPDEFNEAVRKSKLKAVLEEKLAKKANELYGIYLSVEPDAEEPWEDALGNMPPPYLLGIFLVTHEDFDPEPIRAQLVKQIFFDKVSDPDDASSQVTRADLLKRNGIRITQEGVEADTTGGVTLLQLRSYIRYSFVDHLSDSGFSAPQQS